MKYLLAIENVEAAANLLGEIASDGRPHILYRLIEGEATANALAAELGMSPPALDQQLIQLHKLGLVQTRVTELSVYYRCDDLAINKLLRAIAEIFNGDSGQ